MTAIGVGLLVLALLLVAGEVGGEPLPGRVQEIGGWCLIFGVGLTAAGVLTWLWRVMP